MTGCLSTTQCLFKRVAKQGLPAEGQAKLHLAICNKAIFHFKATIWDVLIK